MQNLTLPNVLRRLVSANMGQARAGTLMLDPFAGTGSIMLAAAHFGAATWGGEIHPPMLRGKRKGLNVRSAFAETLSHLLGRISPIFPRFFPFFARFHRLDGTVPRRMTLPGWVAFFPECQQ